LHIGGGFLEKGIVRLLAVVAFLFVSGPCVASDTELEKDLQEKDRAGRFLKSLRTLILADYFL
jgi:hypothetical protein